MVDILIDTAIEIIGGLVIGALAVYTADKVIKNITDRHIHEHIYGWWRSICNDIIRWLQQNEKENLLRLVAKIDNVGIAVRMFIDVKLFGYTDENKEYCITKKSVNRNELENVFPGLLKNKTKDVSYLLQ